MSNTANTTYCAAILQGFEYLLDNHSEVFAIGQGLWSPWYVGNSMKGLKDKYGIDRIVDSPISELAVTGLGIGAGLTGTKSIVIHPRMDFMILAMDQIVNQASNWGFMLNSDKRPNVTIRSIINRGGGQGAQHSQALHSWLAHVPGLTVLMPWSVADARDMLISATLSGQPCIYIDDRWLYEGTDDIGPAGPVSIDSFVPRVVREGSDITFAGVGYAVTLAMETADELAKSGVSAEVIDLRKLSETDYGPIIASVAKTGRLVVFDNAWRNCSVASEVQASVMEQTEPSALKGRPLRVTLPSTPAPAARELEKDFYPNPVDTAKKVADWFSLLS